MEDQNASSQEQDGLAGEVLDSLGVDESTSDEVNDSPTKNDSELDPLYVQKRLKQQKRAHERELRARDQQLQELHSRMNDLQSRIAPESEPNQMNGQHETGNGNMQDTIHKAVALALNHKDEMERKQREAEKLQHVHKQYEGLQKHLDNIADKYDDFDDVVRSHDVPFTNHMRDTALMLPFSGPGSAGEVLYKLAKDRETLSKIKNLHPIDQAKELVSLSHALIAGHRENSSQSSNRQIGNIKSNPVTNSTGISENTSIGELRRRMRQGWK